jgi:hypothetical protein
MALIGSACDGERRASPVEEMPAGAPVSIEAEPILSVGTMQGDTIRELYRVVTPFLHPDGRLVIPLASALTVRVFGPDGEYLTSLGQPGEGPGEFRSIDAAWLRGDTIEVYDGELLRITRFAPNGGIDVVTLIGPPIQSAVPGALPDGWILSRVTGRGEQRSAAATASGRDDIVIHHFMRDGTHAGEIARTEGILRQSVPGGSGPGPLSPRAVLRIGDGLLYVGATQTPLLRVLGPDGSLRADLRWEVDEPASIATAFEAVIDAAVARAPAGRSETTRLRLEAMPVPERLSVWWDFLVDPEGFVWIRPYEPLRHAAALGGLGPGSYLLGGNAQGGRWWIVSPSGVKVGEIEIPSDLSPVQILSDALVGIRRDSLGVEYVATFEIVRR